MIDEGRLILRSEFMDRNSLRVNKLKLIPNENFVNIYIDSGKTKDGGSKYGNIRLEKHQIKELITYLNDLELK